MKNLTTLTLAACAALTLTACGGDPNDDNHINGMDGYMAALLCQKQVAKRAGIDRDQMVDVDADAIRKIRTGDEYHFHYAANDRMIPGGGYACNVHPKDKETATIEVVGL